MAIPPQTPTYSFSPPPPVNLQIFSSPKLANPTYSVMFECTRASDPFKHDKGLDMVDSVRDAKISLNGAPRNHAHDIVIQA